MKKLSPRNKSHNGRKQNPTILLVPMVMRQIEKYRKLTWVSMLRMLTVNSYLEMNNSLNTHLESAKYLRNHVTKKKKMKSWTFAIVLILFKKKNSTWNFRKRQFRNLINMISSKHGLILNTSISKELNIHNQTRCKRANRILNQFMETNHSEALQILLCQQP